MSVQLRNPELIRLLAADFVTRRELSTTAGNRITLTNTDLAVSGGGALTLSAAGAYTLTVPATGTAALLGTANVFTAAQTISADLIVDTNVLMVDSTNNRVGIGTAAPSQRLHIVGTGDLSLRAENASYKLDFGVDGASSFFQSRTASNTAGPLYFYIGSTVRLMINTTGQVGIGTSSPTTSALLDLSSTTGALLLPRMTSTQRDALTATNGMIIYNSTTATIQGYVGGTWTSL